MTSTSRGLVAGLATTETVSWGILYYAFPVLLPAMERDLGWSRTTLIGAYTVAVIVSGTGRLAGRAAVGPSSFAIADDRRLDLGHSVGAGVGRSQQRRRVLRHLGRHRRGDGARPVRAGAGRARQAVRGQRHPGDHHPHARCRVRQHDLPTRHGDPRRPSRVADGARRVGRRARCGDDPAPPHRPPEAVSSRRSRGPP